MVRKDSHFASIVRRFGTSHEHILVLAGARGDFSDGEVQFVGVVPRLDLSTDDADRKI